MPEDFEYPVAYSHFSIYVRGTARYVLNVKQQQFIEAVAATCSKRIAVLQKGTVLWRAQLAHGEMNEAIEVDGVELCTLGEPCPAPRERMLPWRDRACEGRVNPKGIPCLYLASDAVTAMMEVRPWVGAYVSVARFATVRELSVVDFSEDAPIPSTLKELLEIDRRELNERCVWGCMNSAFSEPINPSDNVADYAPTQFLAEVFRSHGYDGIRYRSALGDGKNIALFDIDSATLRTCELYQLERLSPTFKPMSIPYEVDYSECVESAK